MPSLLIQPKVSCYYRQERAEPSALGCDKRHLVLLGLNFWTKVLSQFCTLLRFAAWLSAQIFYPLFPNTDSHISLMLFRSKTWQYFTLIFRKNSCSKFFNSQKFLWVLVLLLGITETYFGL